MVLPASPGYTAGALPVKRSFAGVPTLGVLTSPTALRGRQGSVRRQHVLREVVLPDPHPRKLPYDPDRPDRQGDGPRTRPLRRQPRVDDRRRQADRGGSAERTPRRPGGSGARRAPRGARPGAGQLLRRLTVGQRVRADFDSRALLPAVAVRDRCSRGVAGRSGVGGPRHSPTAWRGAAPAETAMP